MLGLRITPSSIDGFSPALLKEGRSLKIPGDMILPYSDKILDRSLYTAELLKSMNKLGYRKVLWNDKKALENHIPKGLFSEPFVLKRMEGPISSLIPRYSGPYKVISRGKKGFSITS